MHTPYQEYQASTRKQFLQQRQVHNSTKEFHVDPIYGASALVGRKCSCWIDQLLRKEDLPAAALYYSTSDPSTPPLESRQQDVAMDLRMVTTQLELSFAHKVRRGDQSPHRYQYSYPLQLKCHGKETGEVTARLRSLASVLTLESPNHASWQQRYPGPSNTTTPTLSPVVNHHHSIVSGKSSTFSPSQSPAVVGSNSRTRVLLLAIHDLMELQFLATPFAISDSWFAD
jgi:hypothetical protein